MGKNQIIAELREENQRLAIDNLNILSDMREANTKVRQITKQRDEYNKIAVNMTSKLVTLASEKAKLEKELQKAENHRDDYKSSLKAIRIALGFNGETYPKQVIGRIEEMKTQIATQKERLRHTNKLNLEYSGKIASLELNASVGTDSGFSDYINTHFTPHFRNRTPVEFARLAFEKIEFLSEELDDLKAVVFGKRGVLGVNYEETARIHRDHFLKHEGMDYEQLVDTNHKLVAERDSLLSRLSTSSDTVESLSKRLANANLYINQRNQRIDDLIGDSYSQADEIAKLEERNADLLESLKEANTANRENFDGRKEAIAAVSVLKKENDRLSSLVDEAEKRLLDLWVHGSVTNKWVKDGKYINPWLKGWIKAFGYEADDYEHPNYLVNALRRKFGTKASLTSDLLGSEAE